MAAAQQLHKANCDSVSCYIRTGSASLAVRLHAAISAWDSLLFNFEGAKSCVFLSIFTFSRCAKKTAPLSTRLWYFHKLHTRSACCRKTMASPSPFSSEGQSTVGGHSPLETHSNLEVGTEYTENQRHPLPEFHQQAPQYQQATFPAPDSKYAGPATSDGKEHVPNADAGGSGRICGLKKKFFFILLAVAALMAVGLAVGLGVGLTMRSGGGSSNNGGSNDGNSTDGNSKDGPSNPLRSTSKISAASFTDEYSNTNTIVVYQREDRSIYMSTFNSSKEGWTVSPVVDGSSGISLDTVRGDTGLAVDVYQLESKVT